MGPEEEEWRLLRASSALECEHLRWRATTGRAETQRPPPESAAGPGHPGVCRSEGGRLFWTPLEAQAGEEEEETFTRVGSTALTLAGLRFDSCRLPVVLPPPGSWILESAAGIPQVEPLVETPRRRPARRSDPRWRFPALRPNRMKSKGFVMARSCNRRSRPGLKALTQAWKGTTSRSVATGLWRRLSRRPCGLDCVFRHEFSCVEMKRAETVDACSGFSSAVQSLLINN